MTPAEARTLAFIIDRIEDAGGSVGDVEIDYDVTGGLAAAVVAVSGEQSPRDPVFTLEIRADPDTVLDDVSDDDEPESLAEETVEIAVDDGGDADAN